MKTIYTVKYGDTLSKIAQQHGVTWRDIYYHPDNAGFRRKRPDPDVIYPGDIVVVEHYALPSQPKTEPHPDPMPQFIIPMAFIVPLPLKGGPKQSSELTAIGQFARPVSTDAEEIKILKKKPKDPEGWFPSTKDFTAVAHAHLSAATYDTKNLGEFIGAILAQKKNSLSRINIITHGGSSLIAFAGKISYKNKSVTLESGRTGKHFLQGGLDINAINELSRQTTLVSDIRSRLAPGAKIWLIACRSGGGAGLLLMMDLANLFKCSVVAFTDEILYCVTYDDKKKKVIDRSKITLLPSNASVKDTCKKAKKGYKHLPQQRIATGKP